MAGLLDTIIGGPSVEDTRTALQRKLLNEQQSTFKKGISDIRGRNRGKKLAAFAGGNFLGSLLGGAIAGATGIDPVEGAPELVQAKKEQELISNIQELSVGDNALDPNSADFSRKAGEVALEAGNKRMALAFASEATARNKAEAVLAKKTLDVQKKQDQQTFKTLPNDIQTAAISGMDVSKIGELFDLSPENAQAVKVQAGDLFKTLKLKNAQALSKIVPASTSKVTKNDVTQAGENLAAGGVEKLDIGDENTTAFLNVIAQQRAAEIDEGNKLGNRLTPFEVDNGIMEDLLSAGAIEVDAPAEFGGFTFGKTQIKVVDPTLVTSTLKSRLGAVTPAPPAPAAPAAPAAPPIKRQGVLKIGPR